MRHSRFTLDNAEIWVGDGQRLTGHLVVNGDFIESLGPGRGPADLPSVDLSGMALSPGMIDLMVLGGFNRSILRDDPREIAQQYLQRGVTACQFSMGTRPREVIDAVGENIRRAKREPLEPSAEVIGLYCEGPFFSRENTGASQAKFVQDPSPENLRRLLDSIGDVLTQINVSPGTVGDSEAIRQLKARGLTISMAHSRAGAPRIRECLAAGTEVLGHIWDNNSGLIGDSGVQQPTLEHVALTDSRIKYIHLICDGIHADPVLIEILLRCRGVETVCLITDAVPLAGCPDGEYLWDDGRVFRKQGSVGRTDKGDLCGGGLLLPDMFRNFINFTKLPAHEAIRTVTSNPARSLGLDGRLGLLAPGRQADLVGWDNEMRVRRVWRLGNEINGVVGSGEVQSSAELDLAVRH